MHWTISGNRGDTGVSDAVRAVDALSFPIVMLATTFFNAVFLRA